MSLRPRKTSTSQTPVSELAATLSTRVPLVHFPSETRFLATATWDRLRSPSARGVSAPRDRFAALRWENVFTFAGTCCYTRPDDIGDAAIYFSPNCERESRGCASPFDSGALETRRLQPWGKRPPKERWRLFEKHRFDLVGWRARFARWLSACYQRPDRYFDTTGDRYRDGLPERTQPAELLRHNGPQGAETYGRERCADRRAWTWEVRVRRELSFEHARVFHVPFRTLRRALEAQRRWNSKATIRTTPPRAVSSPDLLYRESGAVAREIMEVPV